MKIRAICISLWERLVIQSISAGNATSLLFRGWLFLSLPFCVILQQPFTAYRAADVPVIWIVAYLVQSASFCLPFLGWVSAQVSIREGQSVDLNHRRTKIIRFMCTIHALFWSFTRSVYYFTSHVHDWNISLVYDCHISPYKTTLYYFWGSFRICRLSLLTAMVLSLQKKFFSDSS